MNELEMEVGRLFGASSFYIYQFVKHNPNVTSLDIEIETGLSQGCVQSNLVKLRESKVLTYNLVKKRNGNKLHIYKANEEKETWKLH